MSRTYIKIIAFCRKLMPQKNLIFHIKMCLVEHILNVINCLQSLSPFLELSNTDHPLRTHYIFMLTFSIGSLSSTFTSQVYPLRQNTSAGNRQYFLKQLSSFRWQRFNGHPSLQNWHPSNWFSIDERKSEKTERVKNYSRWLCFSVSHFVNA